METMTDTTGPAAPIASYAFVRPQTTLLAARRPEVIRVRAVYREDSVPLVYIGYPEDTGGKRLPALVRSLAKLAADAAAADLKEPSRFPYAQRVPVEVLVFAAEPEEPGPSAEVFLDPRGERPYELEVVFDGLNCNRATGH